MTFVQDSAASGLTLERVLQDIPTDAGAIIIYVLIAAFIGFIWYGSRNGPEPTGGGATGGEGER